MSNSTSFYDFQRRKLPSRLQILPKGNVSNPGNTAILSSLGDSVILVKPKTILSDKQTEFLSSVWTHFPDRLIGLSARSHFWDNSEGGSWKDTSKWLNEYSHIMTEGAVMSRRRFAEFFVWSEKFQNLESLRKCDDLLLNFYFSQSTGKAPLKVIQKKTSRKE